MLIQPLVFSPVIANVIEVILLAVINDDLPGAVDTVGKHDGMVVIVLAP